MKYLTKITVYLVHASKGCPVITTLVVMLFMLMFNILEVTIEKLIFGERFEHWLDPIFVCAAIAYAAHAVNICALYNNHIK